MERPIIELRTAQLADDFDATNAKLIVEWLIAAEGRKPVVLVGAGFTRNAIHKHRGDYVRQTEAPLWSDVAKAMATHLQVDASQYDAPTMAEMYVASFGDAELRDLLRSMLPDDHLSPGRAHLALASYNLEAVVTTNFLDTLLDDSKNAEHDAWNRVIGDADLSASTKTGRITPDLIYFHGHRCASDTWVMTRSQYEDIARNRPVIVARIRQLMAQHPLLVIGFGLGDSNFHNVYRQISADMRRNQPLGLAIQLAEVSEAERRHWDGLGIRLAVPEKFREIRGDAAQSNIFFERLFKQLSTSWSPSEDAVLGYVLKAKTPESRLPKFKGLLPHRWDRPKDDSHYAEQADRFEAWKRVLFSEPFLTIDDERANELAVRTINSREFDRVTTIASHAVAIAIGGKTVPSGKASSVRDDETVLPASFKYLPQWPDLDETDVLTRNIDSILYRLHSQVKYVAEHFQLALEFDLFRTDAAERDRVPWVPLTFWLALKTLGPGDPVLTKIANQCIVSAEKYGDERGVKLIREEAQRASIDGISTTRESMAGNPPEVEGFNALLDASFELAFKKYREAANRARGDNQQLEEWAWRQGERSGLRGYVSYGLSGDGKVEERRVQVANQLQQCRERIDQLAKTSVVRSWVDLAKDRIHSVLEHALEQHGTRTQNRASGGSGSSFSSSPHMAWKSFRDLEAMHAPPFLQEKHLAPLLWDSGFSAEDELRYRMVFDLKHAREWLKDLVDAPSSTVNEQGERDARLMESFWAATRTRHTRTERAGQVLAFPGLNHALRVSDIAPAMAWLRDVKQALGGQVKTYNSTSLFVREYPSVLRVIAAFEKCETVRATFEGWKATHPLEHEALSATLLRFPWSRWALTEPEGVTSWLSSMVQSGLRERIATGSNTEENVRGLEWGDESFVFAVYTMLAALKVARPGVLPQVQKCVLAFTEKLHQTRVNDTHAWEARRAGYLIEEIYLPQSGSLTQLVARWSSSDVWEDATSDDLAELRWTLISDAISGENPKREETALLMRLTSQLEDLEPSITWASIEKKYCANPHSAEPLIRLLVAGLEALPEKRDIIAPRLLKLLAAAPAELVHMARVLSPQIWDLNWDALTDRVLASASGDVGNVPKQGFDSGAGSATQHQLGAMRLLTEFSRRRRANVDQERGEAVGGLVAALRSAAILALSDERTLLANHASYAIVALAESAQDLAEVKIINRAIARIGGDSRVIVRMAAAYASGRLAKLATSERIRDTAQEIAEGFSGDSNAWIQAQLGLGTLEGEHEKMSQI